MGSLEQGEYSVSLGREGRVTLPAKIRIAMNIQAGHQLLLDWDAETEELRIRPAMSVPRGHAWAYTDDHLDLLREALLDVDAKRLVTPTERYVQELLEEDPSEVESEPGAGEEKIVGILVQGAHGRVAIRHVNQEEESALLEKIEAQGTERTPSG